MKPTLSRGHVTEDTIGEIIAVQEMCYCGYSKTIPIEAYCPFCGKDVMSVTMQQKYYCKYCSVYVLEEEVC